MAYHAKLTAWGIPCGSVYNRLKKNRVTRGLPTSFHSIESKGDSDKLSNMVTLIETGLNIKNSLNVTFYIKIWSLFIGRPIIIYRKHV